MMRLSLRQVKGKLWHRDLKAWNLPFPIGSMGLVYLPIFGWFVYISYGKCRQIYHTWILWLLIVHEKRVKWHTNAWDVMGQFEVELGSASANLSVDGGHPSLHESSRYDCEHNMRQQKGYSGCPKQTQPNIGEVLNVLGFKQKIAMVELITTLKCSKGWWIWSITAIWRMLFFFKYIHPWKLTRPLKRDDFNRKIHPNQPLIFRGHDSFFSCLPWPQKALNYTDLGLKNRS